MEKVLQESYNIAAGQLGKGKVASYIPELATADPMKLGISVTDINGKNWNIGDWDTEFTIQSVGKTIGLLLALKEVGAEQVFSKVGIEATGDPFNSIVRLETSEGKIPLNPMINAGAISVCSLIPGKRLENKLEKLFELSAVLLDQKEIKVDQKVFASERATGDRNRGMGYIMKATGVIEGDLLEHLDLYFTQCSMLVNSRNLSYLGAVLANDGLEPGGTKQLVAKEHARIVRAAMVTAGMYDASGTFARDVGFPAKSGVAGGIVGAVPKAMGIGTYSPALNKTGNSVVGIEALKAISSKLDLFSY